MMCLTFFGLHMLTGQFYIHAASFGMFGRSCLETKVHHRVSHHTSSNGRWAKTEEILTSIEQVEKHGIK